MEKSATQTNRALAGLRPYNDSDLDKLVQLMAQAAAWPPATAPTPADVVSRWARRNVNPQQDVNVLARPSGELVAYSQAVPFKDGTPRLSFEIGVAPPFRRQGIGAALYKLVTERAFNLGATHLTAPVFVLPGQSRPESACFLEAHGFRADYSYWQMRLDNLSAQPPPIWPQGIAYRTLINERADTERWAQLITLAFGEFATGPSVEAQFTEPGAKPEGYLFAVDSRACLEVGTSRARIEIVSGQPVGYIGTVGVLPAYRGRGIAEALVRQTLAYIAAQGVESATLFVENRNLPARRLYEKMGWHPVYRTDHYWKRIVDSSVTGQGG